MMNNRDFVLGFFLGAGAMYLLDPEGGRRRRALIRDQAIHSGAELDDFRDAVAARARHMRNRTRGAIIEKRTRRQREQVDDSVLEERVRSELGRIVPDSAEVSVSAEHGRVTLRGTAPEADMRDLVEGVQEVPGVHDVINRLQSSENAG